MRLTIINQYFLPDLSPTAHLAGSLAEHRAALGDQVSVVTSTGGYTEVGSQDRHAVSPEIRVHRIWTPRLKKSSAVGRVLNYAAFYLASAWRMINLPRQDVVISMTTPPFIALTALLHKMLHPRARIVLWNMDCYPEIAERAGVITEGGFLSRSLRATNRLIFRHLDHVVCLDGAMLNLLRKSYASRGRDVAFSVIPNWEKASLFPADLEPPEWKRATELGLKNKFVILYLGNAGFGHDFELVVEAARRLIGEPIVFLFVGGGAKYPVLQKAVEDHQLDNILLLPYVPKDQTPSVMKSADCALITLQDFALGLVSPSKLHSYLAMDLPVIYIGPQGSNVDEAIEGFNCGISLRNDMHELDRLVDFLASSADEAQRGVALASRSRDVFDRMFCDTKTLREFDRVL